MIKSKNISRKILAINVRYLRFEKGWSQEELGHRANISATSISQIEKARCNTGIDYVDSLSFAFNLESPDLLIKDHGYKEIKKSRIDSRIKK